MFSLPRPFALSLLLLAGCVSRQPLAPVPPPLPEALEWQVSQAHGAFLGVEGEENESGSLDAMSFQPGVRVRRVVENSPAAAAGVQPGDVVLAVGGAAVDDPAALEAKVAAQPAGTSVELSVQRGDTVFGVPVLLAASSAPAGGSAQPRYRLDPSRSRAGWATAPGGAVLVSIAPESPVLEAELALGDVVTAIDGEPVASDRALIRQFQAREPGETVTLAVNGPEGPREVELCLQDEPTRITGLKLPILFDYETTVDDRKTSLGLLDLWVFQLFDYRRDEGERTWVLFEFFGWEVFRFSTGVGELSS